MMPCEARYALLVRLAWELRSLRMSSHVSIPSDAEPVLFVRGELGQRDVVLAARLGERWRLVWRGMELDAEDPRAVARRIAGGAAR